MQHLPYKAILICPETLIMCCSILCLPFQLQNERLHTSGMVNTSDETISSCISDEQQHPEEPDRLQSGALHSFIQIRRRELSESLQRLNLTQ